MIVVIRNASGFDLFLAVTAGEKAVRARVYSEIPQGGTQVQKIPDGKALGMNHCPEGLGVKIDVSKSGLTLRVARRREVVDHLDEDDEIDGEETYLEFTLLLLN